MVATLLKRRHHIMQIRENHRSMLQKKFDRLLVIGFISGKDLGYKKNQMHVICRCDCGEVCFPRAYGVLTGDTKSCGCYQKDVARATFTRHGMNSSRVYKIWHGMTTRANGKGQYYERYGKRGIGICDEWRNFIAFHQWAIKNGYDDTLSIDRIDNNKGYHPKNCRWVTIYQQNQNKEGTIKLTHNGKTMCLSEWSRELGIPRNTLHYRIFHMRLPTTEAFKRTLHCKDN